MRKFINPRRVALVALLTFTAGFYSGCNDNQLKTLATNVDRVAILIGDGARLKDELESQGFIDAAEAKKIAQGLLKVNTALKTFNVHAKSYVAAGELTPDGKADLRKLAANIADAATDLVDNGTFGVKNANTQAQLNLAIGGLKTLTLTILDTVTLIKTKPAGGK